MNNSYPSDNIEKIKVSVIMLTYQRAELIMESIKSLLEQSFEDYELLVIDDGSTDSTKELIENIKDTRVRYFFFEHTGKISSLRNFGLTNSKGEYIAFFDSDDLWIKDKLKKQVDILNDHPDVGITFSDIDLFNSSGTIKTGIYNSFKNEGLFYKGSIFQRLISNRMAIYPSSVLFRKSCLDKVGLMNVNLKPGESNFLIRLCYYFNAYIVYDCWTKIRKHDKNFSILFNRTSFFEEMLYTIAFFL